MESSKGDAVVVVVVGGGNDGRGGCLLRQSDWRHGLPGRIPTKAALDEATQVRETVGAATR